MTRAPSVSSRPGRSATSRLQVTGTDRSAAGSRRVRNTVAAPRRDSWAICPSTHTSPSRPIHSATLRATVRTGHGASGVEGEVTPRACQTVPTLRGAARGGPVPGPAPSLVTCWNGHPSGTRAERARRGGKGGPLSDAAGGQRAVLDGLALQLLQPVAQHPQVGLEGPGGLLVVDQLRHGGQLVAAQPAAQLGDGEAVVALDRGGAGGRGAGGVLGLVGGPRLVDVGADAGRRRHVAAALVGGDHIVGAGLVRGDLVGGGLVGHGRGAGVLTPAELVVDLRASG